MPRMRLCETYYGDGTPAEPLTDFPFPMHAVSPLAAHKQASAYTPPVAPPTRDIPLRLREKRALKQMERRRRVCGRGAERRS